VGLDSTGARFYTEREPTKEKKRFTLMSLQDTPQFSDPLPYTAKLPCLLRGSFYRFRKCATSFYAVGKIAPNGWREPFAGRNDMPYNWEGYLKATPITAGFVLFYTGPFFISCDHGCAHGNESHGTDACTDGFDAFRPSCVFYQSVRQIRHSGFVLVWAGVGADALDTAYGSLVEIGIAHALGTPIMLAHHPQADLRPFWFAVEAASAVVCAEMPLDALEMLHETRECGR